MDPILSLIIPIVITYFIYRYKKNQILDDKKIWKNRQDYFYKGKKVEKRKANTIQNRHGKSNSGKKKNSNS